MNAKGGGTARNRKLIRAVILLGMFVVMLNSVIIVLIYHSLSSTASLISGAAVRFSQETVETASLCTNNPPSITAIGGQKAVVGEEFTLQVSANPANPGGNNALLRYYDNTTLFNINNNGYIKFTPNENQVSQYVLITVKEDSGCADQNSTETFLLTIIDAAPTITRVSHKAAANDLPPSLPPDPPKLPPIPIAGISLNYDILF